MNILFTPFVLVRSSPTSVPIKQAIYIPTMAHSPTIAHCRQKTDLTQVNDANDDVMSSYQDTPFEMFVKTMYQVSLKNKSKEILRKQSLLFNKKV